MNIKRYDFHTPTWDAEPFDYAGAVESPTGEYVKYEDIKYMEESAKIKLMEIQTKIASLAEELDCIMESINNSSADDIINELRKLSRE